MLDEAHRASESQATVPDFLWSYSRCDGASCRQGAGTFQGDLAQGCKAGYTLVPSSAALPFVRRVSILDSNFDKVLAIDFPSRVGHRALQEFTQTGEDYIATFSSHGRVSIAIRDHGSS